MSHQLFSQNVLFFCVFVFSFLFLVFCHPQKHSYSLSPLSSGSLPTFRSYHAHVIFHRRRSDDKCIGYDDAMILKGKFEKFFNVSKLDCQADFDLGNQICMFPTAMGPFGPFPLPEFAAYVPVDYFAPVVQFYMQNRGPFSVFVHPNSGYERNDHGEWGLWMGETYQLDLSDFEFSPQLPPLYNTSCRDEPSKFPFPTGEPALIASNSHVRILSMQSAEKSYPVVFSFSNSETKVSFSAIEKNQQTWYRDINPNTYTICANDNMFCHSQTVLENEFYTLVALGNDILFIHDNNSVADTESMIRFVNLLPDSVISVYMDGVNIISWLKFKEVSDYYFPSANAQHLFEFKDYKGALIVTEPYYTNAGSVETVWIFPIPSAENSQVSALLSFDFPHDSPL